MNPGQFHRHIEEGPPATTYLFLGPAELLAEEAWKALLRVLMPGKSPAAAFGPERLSAKDVTVSQVVSRISTLPMFGSRRPVMVRNVEGWTDKERKALLAYLEKPAPTGCLVLRALQKKGVEAIEAAVARTGQVVLFEAMKDWEAPKWAQDRALSHGRTMTAQAAALLVELIGTDLGALDQELEKLTLYCGDRKKIDVEDVRESASAQRVHNVFELMRSIGDRHGLKAVATLKRLIETGQPPLGILALLARQVRQIWQVKDMLARNLAPDRIARDLKIPTSAVRGYVQNARQFTEADLRRVHRALCETDIAFKSSGTPPELLLQALVLTLSRT